MKRQPWLVIPQPMIQRLPDGTYYASSSRFPDLWAVERSAEAAGFVLRLLVQKRLYGQSWTWAPGTPTSTRTSTPTSLKSAAMPSSPSAAHSG